MIDLPPTDPVSSNTVTYEMIQRVADVTKTPIVGLYLILQQEAGTLGECNATKDCGPFQVNRQHYEELKAYGLTEHMIVNTAWGNAYAAGIILRQKINVCSKWGYDFLGQIACYHSFTPHYHSIYKQHLYRHAQKLNRQVSKAQSKAKEKKQNG